VTTKAVKTYTAEENLTQEESDLITARALDVQDAVEDRIVDLIHDAVNEEMEFDEPHLYGNVVDAVMCLVANRLTGNAK